MKWTLVSLAVVLSFSGSSVALFDSNGVGSVENLLVARGGHVQLQGRQAGSRCGPDGGNGVCSGNLCCSAFGYCGDGDQYCPQIVGCQPQYGWCEGEPLPSSSTTSTTTRPTSTSTSTSSTSTTSTPPPVTTTTSTTSSSTVPTSTSTIPPPTGPLLISQNGMCGNGTTCAGSRFGRCCSQFYYCGNEDSFCGGGCQPGFGSCGVAVSITTVTITSSITVTGPGGGLVTTTVTAGGGGVVTTTVTSIISTGFTVTTTVGVTTTVPTTISTTSPPVTIPPTTTSTTTSRTTTSSTVSIPAGLRSSTDGTCGDGVTCLGSSGGQCCSQWGYCGDDRQFCVPLLGCQPQFGRCDAS